MKTRYRLPIFVLAGLLLLLLVLHLALPYVVRDYLNGKLADMGDYRGHITDVDLAWWRGAYRINGLEIVKADGDVPVPFVEAPLIDLAVSWHSLWYDHAVVASVLFQAPTVNFVDGGESDDSQTGEGTDWREQLEKLLPITLDEIRVADGTLSFRNFSSTPPVNISAKQINASLYNLTNVKDDNGTRVARFEGKAMLLDHAPMQATALFDPFKDFQDFEVRLRATDIDLPRLNDFSAAYGKFDFKAGNGDLVIEATAADGELTGYIKPLLHDVDVFDWRQDVESDNKGFFRGLWEAVVGGTENILKNQRKNQFATRVELSGRVDQQNISPFQAFIAILRNGFVQAFNSRFEREAPGED